MASGSDPYDAKVNAPTPVALTVTPDCVAVATPAAVFDVALADPVAPAGAPGGAGACVVEVLLEDVPLELDELSVLDVEELSVLEVEELSVVEVELDDVVSWIVNGGLTWLVTNCPVLLPK